MRTLVATFAAAAAIAVAAPACAALADGAPAPTFKAEASMAGNAFQYDLAKALAKGPVVLYFYPAAFTPGCTIEAHDFAAATAKYEALGATVIGVSRDDIDTLKRFSVSECRSKFAVAADTDGAITKAYDAVMPGHEDHANRVSYVITPDAKVLYSYTSLNPAKHVANTLAALREWDAKRAKAAKPAKS